MTWERWNEYDNLHGSVKGKGSDKSSAWAKGPNVKEAYCGSQMKLSIALYSLREFVCQFIRNHKLWYLFQNTMCTKQVHHKRDDALGYRTVVLVWFPEIFLLHQSRVCRV
jgi:hypothetical protein